MKVLFIAPLPPPIAGDSLAAKVFYDHLSQQHTVATVNLSKQTFQHGFADKKRVFDVFKIFRQVARAQKNADAVYLSIAESFGGNLKDLIIYTLCRKRLDRTFIHLHGGSIKRLLWDERPWLHRVNKFFISRLAGVIISGESHLEVFDDKLPRHKIHIIPNFAFDDLFAADEVIRHKFATGGPLRLLYMSSMIEKKGYEQLAKAYALLPPAAQEAIRIDFAGRFELDAQKEDFLNLIAPYPQLRYHGMVDAHEKQALFAQAQVFCLPTTYLEGQPISILEAYASGCVVATTGQSGILDIFSPGQNGFLFADGTADAIAGTLQQLLTQRPVLQQMGTGNAAEARKKYRTHIYATALTRVLETLNKA